MSNGATSFLECREYFVRVPQPIIQRVPEDVLKIQPRVFKILATKKELKISMLTAASTSFTLPMPVHVSPIVTLLKTDPNAQQDLWKPRYVPFSDSYAELGQLFTAVAGGMYADPPGKVQEILQQFSQQGELQATKLADDLTAIATSTSVDEKEKMSQFLLRLEMATIELINRYETFLHKCLVGDEQIPLALCLTPAVFPTVEDIHEDKRGEFFDLFTQYWQTKVDVTNEKLEMDARVVPQQWITIEGLRQAHTQVSPSELWRGYLTPKTAAEYLNYFTKLNDI